MSQLYITVPCSLGFYCIYIKDRNGPIIYNCTMLICFHYIYFIDRNVPIIYNFDMLICFHYIYIIDRNGPIIYNCDMLICFHYIYIIDRNVPIIYNCAMLIGFPLHIPGISKTEMSQLYITVTCSFVSSTYMSKTEMSQLYITVPCPLGFHYINIKDRNVPIIYKCDMLICFHYI